jgi:hypothetical protein
MVILLLAGLFSYGVAEIYNFPSAKPEAGFNLIDQNNAGVEVEYNVPQMSLESLDIDGRNMQAIMIPGVFLPNNAGAPNLPGSGRIIAIPQGAAASVQVLSSSVEYFQGIDLAPAPPIQFENDNSPPVYEKDLSIYNVNAYYPENPVLLSDPSGMRGVDYVMLGVTPFQYNPVTRELVVYTNLRVQVNFIGGNGHFGEDRLRSLYWEPVLAGNILNYQSLPKIDFNQRLLNPTETDDFEYIIIVPDDPAFVAWADTIKQWRTLQGIRTGVVNLTDIGGNNSAAIENYINNAYNTWDIPPVAVLLLSDYQNSGLSYGITSPMWDNYCVSDNIYADINGDDLPDMAFSRITAQNEGHLSGMIGKFLDYERNPPTNPSFYQNPITAGGWQTERWFIICTEICWGFMHNVLDKSPVREYAIYSGSPGSSWSSNSNTYMLVNYFGPNGLGYIPSTPQHLTDWGANATRINNDINNGAFLMLHRDHGLETGWGEPDYNIGNLSGLNNEDLCFVFSINCLTGKYNYGSQVFSEAFHRMENGALGLLCASEVSYSFVNDTYIFGIWDYLWPNFDPGYGENDLPNLNPCFANASGKHYLQASNWPYNPQHKVYTHHLFHHFGDPFNTINSEVPSNLTVIHDPILFSGFSEFYVTADTGSRIGLTVNGEIIGAGQGTGSPTAIQIIPQNPGNTMIVTITKPNYYRYSQEVDIIPPSGYGMMEGVVTDQVTGQGLTAIVTVTNRVPQIIAYCNNSGYYYMYVPSDTAWNIRAEYTSDYLPSFETITVAEGDTTTLNIQLEPKVEVHLKASFGNPADINYRAFYFRGSWDDDGFYSSSWACQEFMPMRDDGVYPDEISGDGVFTGSVLLATDLAHDYSWCVFSENYTEEAVLHHGADFSILNPANPPAVPVLAVNPSGSENDWTLTVEGDNTLAAELSPGYNNTDYLWSGDATMNAGTTYHFRIFPMHSDSAAYGSGGVGGTEFVVTPNVTESYTFIFNDEEDDLFIDSAYPSPEDLVATLDMDEQVVLNWEEPRIDPDTYIIYRSDDISGPFTQIGTVPGTTLTYTDETAVNYHDYYYQVTSMFAGNNQSLPSNTAHGYAITGARLEVAQTSYDVWMNPGNVVELSMHITNGGDLDLDFVVATSTNEGIVYVNPGGEIGPYTEYVDDNPKTMVDNGNEPQNPPQTDDGGGPDAFGYIWKDSNEPGGPQYNWVDISSIGTPVTLGDESNVGPFSLGFVFEFYGVDFNSYRVCSNGWVSFTSSSTSYSNREIPYSSEPNNLLAGFWDDLNPGSGGQVYRYQANDSAVVSWVGVPHYSSGGPYTFQIIILASGTITYQYQTMNSPLNSASIGIENANGTIGLQVVYNQNYVENEMAIRFTRSWLAANPEFGVIAPDMLDTVTVTFDGSWLAIGDYTGTLTVDGSDIYHNEPTLIIPVTMHISDQVGVDDVTENGLPREFSLSQNYPNPFNAQTAIKYALPRDSQVRIEIFDLLGRKVTTLVNEDKEAGVHEIIWNSDRAASGIYFYRMQAGDFSTTSKMLLLR